MPNIALYKNSIILQFSRYASIVLASLGFNKTMKQVQYDGIFFVFFIKCIVSMLSFNRAVENTPFNTDVIIMYHKYYADRF